jgi:predicted HAD superfamily Cof-like phosphohydrolase
MQTGFDDVGEFHQKFGLDNTTWQSQGPREVDRDLMVFRMKFLCEELQEFLEGVGLRFRTSLYSLIVGNSEWCAEKSHEQMFDALIDLVYVAYGTAHVMGYPWQAGWDQVQMANMQKERATRAEQSERGGTFDVIKPEGWTPPDIHAVLKAYGFFKEPADA